MAKSLLMMLVVLAAAALVALGSACDRTPKTGTGTAVKTGSLPPETKQSRPTEVLPRSPLNSVAEDDTDALSYARDFIDQCPSYCGGSVTSVTYVQTTVRAIETMLGSIANEYEDVATKIGYWHADSNLVVWVVVAHGYFAHWAMGETTPFPSHDHLWIFIPKDRRGSFWVASNMEADLSPLGDVHEKSLPLPDYPTPVSPD